MGNFSPILDFILPRFCPACKLKITGSEFVCNSCLLKIKKPSKERIVAEFNKKFGGKGIILDFTSRYVFERDKEFQHIIHSLKYEKKFLLGTFLGKLLGETINSEFSKYHFDFIVPVPLHHLKKAEREYNQSYYIAKGVQKVTGIKTNNHLIKRVKYTESQTSMKLTQREKNIINSFKALRKLKGENILIIDDVITTGATISECGKTLLRAGAGKIYAASTAIAD